ncbi:MAG: acetylglutamate kinase [Deltaproteobacteria bacterium]|jgi:acetylglutamate kinase|nr:acetylglutamate kinase [Deltaproteobacteria bacterium]MDR1298405.1 acetylglutamate kinase [Deltaproteobacteria bacterium]
MSENRADLLVEALPYIKNYRNSTLVIKYGGHAMVDEGLRDRFAQDVSLLRFVGINPVVVHGGGPQIDEILNRLNIKFHFVEGQRYTDEAVMKVVEMVLCGRVGKDIVGRITRAGSQAVGLSGKDAGLIRAVRKRLSRQSESGEDQEQVDIGLVGEPTGINVGLLNHLTDGGFIPVIAPVGVDDNGVTYNINADSVAAAVAVALSASRLILLTDIKGVLDLDGQLLERLTEARIKELKKAGGVTGGMIPKLDCCLSAIRGGCRSASIIDGRVPHALLLELFTDSGCGTEILP